MADSSPFFYVAALYESKQVLELRASLDKVLAHVPEAEECHCEADSPIEFVILEQPVQRSAKIINLGIASCQPLGPCDRVELRISFRCENQEIRCVTPSRRGPFATQVQALERVFTDCLEHGESWFRFVLIDSLYETFVQQG